MGSRSGAGSRAARLAVVLWALLGGGVSAQAAPEPASASSAPAVVGLDEAVVTVFQRPIVVLRGSLFGLPPRERARRTERGIRDLLALGGPGAVTIAQEPVGSVVSIDGTFAIVLTPADVDPLRRETLSTVAESAAFALRQAIAEGREARDHSRLLRALAWSAGATLAFAGAVWAIWRLRNALVARATRAVARRTERARLAGEPIVKASRVQQWVGWAVRVMLWSLVIALVYQWLVFVLTRFPFTRVWGERLGSLVVDAVSRVGQGIVGAIPDLLVALLIFLLGKLLADGAQPLFDRVERGEAIFSWLDRDTVGPTRRIYQVAVWLFAVVMAYPYLPGADSDAFKGVSVLVGVMLTLGGSSLIGQGASGLILMYSRTLRVGEYVRINDQEGTVTELGAFATKIRTGLGEEVAIPNAVVLSNPTKNYSRAVKGRGYVVDTTVSIGYDTPWREVEALLVAAAARTEGILASPAPRVFQTSLEDFYIVYRLVAQAVPELPRPRAEVLTQLHANILDAFNAAGVQIMSPHYLGDPADPKLVPPG